MKQNGRRPLEVYLGTDHGGFELKAKIKSWLREWGYGLTDCGAHELETDDDYPQYALHVAQDVVKANESGRKALGVLLCRSGGGMAITANKVSGVRAVLAGSVRAAEHARSHDDANVVSIAADWTEEETAKKILQTFLETNFSNDERHKRRLEQITSFERSNKLL